MQLSKIFVQLPPTIGEALITGLERTNVTKNADQLDVHIAAEQLVVALIEQHQPSADVIELLQEVPRAVVHELFHGVKN